MIGNPRTVWCMPALGVRRRRFLLELDLTEMPVEQEPDDPISRLRSRGRHRLRPTLRALHEAADDPRVVGLIAKVGGCPAMGGHAGAAPGRAGLRGRRQADAGVGRNVRRGNGWDGRLRAGDGVR